MVCKVQLIDTSNTFLAGGGWCYKFIISGSDAILGTDYGNTNTQLRKAKLIFLVCKWYKINAPLTSSRVPSQRNYSLGR